KRAVTVAARALERDAVPVTTDRDGGDGQARTIDGDESVDPSFQRVAEHAPHAAQVAEPFFADIRNERDRTARSDARMLERPRNPKEHRQPTAVVGDAWCPEE